MLPTRPALRPLAVLAAAVLAGGLAACDEAAAPSSPTSPGVSARAAADLSADPQGFAEALGAQQAHDAELRARNGVVGTAVGRSEDGEFHVVLYLVASGAARGLPDRLDDVPVRMVVTGPFVADADETSRQRPAPVGFSVGHPDITAGTLGARVVDGGGALFILSNNHVLADVNAAEIGDPTLQPGPSDGGTSSDSVAHLADYEPIAFSGTNYIDAAVSRTVSDNVDFQTSAEGYGTPSATIVDLDGDGDPATIGTVSSSLLDLPVQKYGRTTGLTKGTISEVAVSADVCYICANPVCTRCAESAHFEDQIAVTPGDFSDGGDSGSLIVTDDADARPVALLYAGSSSRTLGNRIDRVLKRFSVEVDDGSSSDGGSDTNSAPTAEFTKSCTDLTCDFDGSGSSDSDGSIASYDWDFGDGTGGTGETVSHTYDSGDTYTVTLTVTDDDGATDSQSQDVTVSTSTDAGGIHVGDLDGASTSQGRTWTATVTVAVHDVDHSAEEGSTVSFSYSGRDVSGTASCTTGTDGTCMVEVSGIRKRTGSVTFEVTGVSDTDGSYSATDNHDPDGDSDGTTITVNKP